MKIEFGIADIARQPTSFDAVVNSANSNLRFGTGVVGAIQTAAGPELEAYCEPLAPLALGKAIITPGFKLANRWVIHIRSAHYLNDEEPEQTMAEALRALLRLAGQHHIKAMAMAMPAIGTGSFKFPPDLAADIIVKALKNDAPTLAPELQRVRICLTSWHMDRAFRIALHLNDPSDQRPQTVSVAVQHLIETLPQQTLKELSGMKEEELFRSHFGLGLYLRNNMLHGNYALRVDLGVWHPDDASGALVDALWKALQNTEKTA